MKNQDLKTLLKTLREFGAVSYESNGVKVLLDPNFQPVTSNKSALKSTLKPVKSLQEQVDQVLPQMDDESWLLAGVKPEDEVEDYV